MYIVIAGAGLVGRGLADRLAEAHHDVVVIDFDAGVCEWMASHSGVLTVRGSATSIEVLEQAGMAKADVAVGTMRVDADNLAFAVLAKSFDVPRVIVRMRDRRYESAYKQAGASTTVNIADVFANQLLLEIEDPNLRQIATFGAGKAAIAVDIVPQGATISGKTVQEIAAEPNFPEECVITGIYRPDGQTFVVPRGSATIEAGDRVFLVAKYRDLRKASKLLHRKR